ncbi:MAG: peptidase [Gammaproteobacteria bacterium]|nr:peptidase [Gammaproteobacteria bacterium]
MQLFCNDLFSLRRHCELRAPASGEAIQELKSPIYKYLIFLFTPLQIAYLFILQHFPGLLRWSRWRSSARNDGYCASVYTTLSITARKRKILSFIIMASFITTVFADNQNNKLSHIKNEIESLKQSIAQDKDSYKTAQNDLQATEIKMNHFLISISQLEKKMSQLQNSIARLNQQISILQNNLLQEEADLGKEMRNAYEFGQDSAVKLILNTEAPNDLQRMMQYFRLLNEDKVTSMKKVKDNLDQLLELQQHLEQRKAQLQNIRLQEQDLVRDLKQQQLQRQKLITAINDTLTAKTDRLNALQQNRRTLEGLVQQLKTQPAITTLPPFSFPTLRGRLPWPLSGTIVEHFGSSVEESNLQWSGVLIDTPQNTPVRAIYPGRVIFADWLKGFGLLVIIDHGQDYMSLYGRNDALMVKTGDNISFGQIIARAGSTGGYDKSSLYFEIRHQGDPVDPEQWCKGTLQ